MAANDTTDTSSWNVVSQCIWNYKEESQYARRNREIQNRRNFECYNLRQDYSHKKRGQSKEFLDKQAKATEQLASFLQQGLMDLGDWFRIDLEDGIVKEKVKIDPKHVEKLLVRQLDKNDFSTFFNDLLKLGLLGSLMIIKVGGKMVKKCEYKVKNDESDVTGTKKVLSKLEKDVWQLDLQLVRQEDFFPDPTGRKLYEVQRIEMDYHDLVKLAKDHPDDFDMVAIQNIQTSVDEEQKTKKARETGQNVTYSQYRKTVTIFECWGKLIERGTGEVLHDNCVSAIDLQGNLIRPPKPNPNWHQESPYVTSPILRVPLSVWHKAVMDATTLHNQSINEIYNLLVDGALMEIHGIKQLHSQWLENPNQVADGIPPGTTLLVNNSCPPGQRIMERVDTATITPEAVQIYGMVDRELQASALTNDTRMGNLPQRQVKATEIVSANQSLTGVMNGIVKTIEEKCVAALLDKSWQTMAQHMNDLDSDEVAAIVGDEAAKILKSMRPEEVFAETVLGHKYKVFGLSTTLNKIQDFRKITSLLQSIGNSPQMMQEFTRKYSMPKLLGEIVKSLDIDEDKIIASPEEIKQRQAEMDAQNAAMAAGPPRRGANTKSGQGTNPQSQIPQAANAKTDNGLNVSRGMNNIGMTHPS